MSFQGLDHYKAIFENKGLDLSDRTASGKPRRVSMREWLDAGRNQLNAVLSDREITFADTVATPDITPWLPRVIEQEILDAYEPRIVLTRLFEKVSYEPGTILELPALGAVEAYDIAEGQEYPLVRFQEIGAVMRASVGKSGLAYALTEEAINHSRYDLIQRHLRKCGEALARHKEVKAANLLTNLGIVYYNNLNPLQSVNGVTTGRDMTGAANASMTLDDLFTLFGGVMSAGFVPDTVIVHPMTYLLFIQDETLRTIALAGGNQPWFGTWTGNPAMRGPGNRTSVSGGQKKAALGTATSQNELNTQLDSGPVFPSRWPWPFRVVVSPWVPYNPKTKRTDIIVADGANLGLYIEEHGVKVDKWDDLSRDVTTIKLKERYNFGIVEEGLAVGVMKNVKVVPNGLAMPPRAVVSASGNFGMISPTTPV